MDSDLRPSSVVELSRSLLPAKGTVADKPFEAWTADTMPSLVFVALALGIIDSKLLASSHVLIAGIGAAVALWLSGALVGIQI